MDNRQTAFARACEGIIANLKKRNMEGYFFEDSASCVRAILEMMPEGSVVSWGRKRFRTGERDDGCAEAGKLPAD